MDFVDWSQPHYMRSFSSKDASNLARDSSFDSYWVRHSDSPSL
jgi:hypothetical protein